MAEITRTIIAMDPPWDTDNGGGGRGAQCHYPTLPFADIVRVIHASPFAPDAETGCHVWCWYTALSRQLVGPLFDALGVRDTGFERIWVKGRVDDDKGLVLHQGLGQYGRSCHEYLRLGVVGSAPVHSSVRPPSVLLAPARGKGLRHSQKPAAAYNDALRMRDGALGIGLPTPPLELFARTPRPGWDVWGNEVT